MSNPATPVFRPRDGERSPGGKLLMAILVGFLLAIPLFSVYLLNYDRQSQSTTASQSIVEGWGGPQVIGGPVLVIPYQAKATETVEEGGKQVVKSTTVWKELVLSPETATVDTNIKPERRKRSIYEAVVYEANLKGQARFVMPGDLERIGGENWRHVAEARTGPRPWCHGRLWLFHLA
jgi:inner membrane protein